MLFKDFAQILYNNCAGTDSQYQYFLLLFDSIMRDPSTKEELEQEKNDKYNPFDSLQQDTIERLFRGGNLNVKKLRVVYQKRDTNKFAKYIQQFDEDTQLNIEKDIKNHLPQFISEEDDIGYACADLFVAIIHDQIDDEPILKDAKDKISTADELRKSFYYDPTDNKIHIDNTIIELPPQLLPPEGIADEEGFYIAQLLNAYAEALGSSKITIDDVPSLKRKYRDNFEEQRINYYSAIRIDRILRESFANPDIEMKTWKSETYDYISDTLRDEYDNGFKRLVEVLKTVIHCKTTSVVDQCERLIGPKERKGVCHLLEIDWTDDYE